MSAKKKIPNIDKAKTPFEKALAESLYDLGKLVLDIREEVRGNSDAIELVQQDLSDVLMDYEKPKKKGSKEDDDEGDEDDPPRKRPLKDKRPWVIAYAQDDSDEDEEEDPHWIYFAGYLSADPEEIGKIKWEDFDEDAYLFQTRREAEAYREAIHRRGDAGPYPLKVFQIDPE